MSDDHTGPPARRPYNRPRRYPVPAASAADVSGPDASAEVTRQNPTLAAAAQDYEQRFGPLADAPTAPLPLGYPVEAPRDPYPPATGPARSRTVSGRTVLVGVAVLAVIAVVGLVLGLSGGSDSTPKAGASPGTPTSSVTSSVASSVAAGATPSPTLPAPEPASTSAAPGLPGGDGSPAAVCARLGATAPFTSFVSAPRPAGQMPATYVEPEAGTRIAICVGTFRSGGGAGRGRVAYLAEYTRLPATQYAAQLRTLNWVPEPNLPRPTYRNNLTTTVTLVQQGSALVTVVGTGG